MLSKENIPNLLTLLRICMVPVIVSSFYVDSYLASWVAAALFAFASLTDFVDGYLARIWQVQSYVGKVLDPIADKVVVISSIVMIIHKDLIGDLSIIPALAIICREIIVSGLREFLSGENVHLPAIRLAKFKTIVQMVAVISLIMSKNFSAVSTLGEYLLWLAAALTLFSGYTYCRMGLKHIYGYKGDGKAGPPQH